MGKGTDNSNSNWRFSLQKPVMLSNIMFNKGKLLKIYQNFSDYESIK